MAYNFTKLSETPIVESTDATPNILIEDNGDIKRISADDLTTPQVNADWNETDVTSPSFIMNKPESLDGGGVKFLCYTVDSGALMLNGVSTTASEVVEEWKNGSILRVKTDRTLGSVINVTYTLSSGAAISAGVSFYVGTNIHTILL